MKRIFTITILLVASFFAKSQTWVSQTSGGITWTNQISRTTDALVGLSFYSATNGIVTSSNGKILVTNDGGLNWTMQT